MSKPLPWVRKIVSRGLFFFFIGIVGLWTANRFLRLTDLSLFVRAPADKKFMSAWDDDIKRLDRAKVLPAGFKNLKEVQIISPSEKLRGAFKKYPLSLDRSSKGKFNLEIFMDEIDGGGVVVQYDLVEIKSGNTIWELGRTFPHNINK